MTKKTFFIMDSFLDFKNELQTKGWVLDTQSGVIQHEVTKHDIMIDTFIRNDEVFEVIYDFTAANEYARMCE